MKNLLIKIEQATEGGYVYEIFDGEDAFINNDDSLAGGGCSGSLASALDMAYVDALALAKDAEPWTAPGSN